MMKILVLLLLITLGYLLYLILLPKRRDKVLYTQLKQIPELQVRIEDLANNIWLKYNDELAKTYYEIIEKTEQQLQKGQNISFSQPTPTTQPLNPPAQETTPPQNLQDTSLPTPLNNINQGSIENISKNVEPSTDTTKEQDVSFSDPVISEIYKEFVLPFAFYYKEQNALDIALKGLSILETYGNCSSLTSLSTKESDYMDSEVEDLNLYKDILAKVTLKDHTYHVVSISFHLLKEKFSEYQINVPRIIIASLFHDLGKIPEFWLSSGKKAHNYVSANILYTVAKEVNASPFWLDQVAQIIRDHHLPTTKDPFVRILQEADKKARVLELSQSLSQYSITPFENWFSLDEFISDLAKEVNNDKHGVKWYAFSFKDVIYLKPDGLFELVELQRNRKKAISEEFVWQRKEEKMKIVLKVVNLLNSKGFLVEGLIDPKANRIPRFKIYRKDGRTYSMQLIPIKLTIYNADIATEIQHRFNVSAFNVVENVTLDTTTN